jgi:hypothetical protein
MAPLIDFRDRAREFRVLAGMLTDLDEKRTALKISEDYEKLARLADARNARHLQDSLAARL